MTRMNQPLLASTEGRILAVGITLFALMLLAFGIGWQFFPGSVLTYAAMAGLNLIIGRAAGMSYGYANGLDHVQVVPLNMLVETIQVFVVYPLFVLSLRKLIQLPTLQPFFARMQSAAQSRGGMVKKFGIIGLFVFVFVPFWMTGPVMGSIIGFLIGLRTWVNLTVVLVSTYVTIGVWGLLLNELSDWAATVNEFAPYALVLAVALLTVVMLLLHWRQNRPGNSERA
jgi:uncharacterized membrane protein